MAKKSSEGSSAGVFSSWTGTKTETSNKKTGSPIPINPPQASVRSKQKPPTVVVVEKSNVVEPVIEPDNTSEAELVIGGR